jgi:hypothetical protein
MPIIVWPSNLSRIWKSLPQRRWGKKIRKKTLNDNGKEVCLILY